MQAPTEVTVTINGEAVSAKPGELLIAAAERSGVYIPRFCYHPRMKPVGMCRMCVVDVDTGRGPALQPACMLPVAEGMVVETESERTKHAQDGVLEFLLINHPLDCPVCDKGGECPLQDQTLAFGPGESRFVEEKRHYEKPISLSPLVYMDRERCILCDRCTRFSKEVAGDPLISFINRGNATEVNTFPDDPFASYFSGNTVQICPVGALTAVPYRFKARPWDLDQVESTCTSCSVGCRVALQSSSNQVVRLLGVDVDPVNHGWLCDKGRFDFEALASADRVAEPMVKQGDSLQQTTWSDALTRAADALKSAGEIGIIGGARLTNEDAFAWAKLARTVIETEHVDAQLGDGLPAEVVLGLPKATIDEACAAGTLVLLGGDIKEELPVLYLRLRDAVVERGLNIVEVSPTDTGMTRYATTSVRYAPGAAASAIRELTLDGDVVCVLGRPSLAEPADSIVAAASALLEKASGATFLSGLRRGNVHGALDMGLAPNVLPGRVAGPGGGMDTTAMLTAAAEGRLATLVLLGADPLADFPDRELARRALAGAGTVIAVDAFLTESSSRADVVLAAAAYGEKAGTTTNLEGRVSRLNQKVTAPGTARADWMIAAELAFRLDGDLGFERVEDIWDEIERTAPAHAGITRTRLAGKEGLDGVVVGREPVAHDGAGVPSMAETDDPGIRAVDAQGSTEDAGGPAGEQPDPKGGEGPTGDPAVTEATTDAPMDGSGDVEGDAAAMETLQDSDPEQTADPAGGGAASSERPAMITFTPVIATADVPAVDSYSLRLVVGRTLYDGGTFVQRSSSLSRLANESALRVNPGDLDRLGVTSGGQVRVTSSRTSLTLGVVADERVPRGVAALAFNQLGVDVGELIDVTSPVTDVRVETV
ncbi:MAG TPA: NADH-quinone oxidoreductase subunit NuoG [Acidimicrobiales bacterium]|nr:NADH-quinone oxidoreductase subunit NuoG [Acidimicrobiales bacterium]